MIAILPNKTKTVRTLGKVDISGIKDLVSDIPQAIWDMETKNRENEYELFNKTQHVLFRFHGDRNDHTLFYDKPLWRIWQNKLMPIMKKAVEPYGYTNGKFPKIMFAKLLAGKEIGRHIDAGPRNRQVHKIHIPISTNPEVYFYVEEEGFHMEAGHAYEVNNIVRHHAINGGDSDRIHLIFEYFGAK